MKDTVLKVKNYPELDSHRSGFAARCIVLKIKNYRELDSHRSGFAARCEARLCLAVQL